MSDLAAQAAVEFEQSMRRRPNIRPRVLDRDDRGTAAVPRGTQFPDHLADPRPLATRIKAFWLREGFEVAVFIKNGRDIRSSLVDGLPRK